VTPKQIRDAYEKGGRLQCCVAHVNGPCVYCPSCEGWIKGDKWNTHLVEEMIDADPDQWENVQGVGERGAQTLWDAIRGRK
jgi:hypothetical protein